MRAPALAAPAASSASACPPASARPPTPARPLAPAASPVAGRQGGFTLLELLVAVALMGVLAVLCWRGLDTVLRSRDVIVQNNDELRALTAAFAQLDDDLRRSWTVRLLRISSRDPIRFTRASPDGPVALELLRESGSLDERVRIQQVIYRLRDGQLERGFGPWQPDGRSADGSMNGPMASAMGGTTGSMTGSAAGGVATPAIVWQPLLANVAALEMRAWIEQQKNWTNAAGLVGVAFGSSAVAEASVQANVPPGGTASPAAAAAAATVSGARTITGVEVALARRNSGRIVRVFTVKD
ncbi:MAG TPA: prepilin-type N-terminal cleavage/methylation domain-containing protein [Burkholderiaceae bacterium]|nr:prepilin-type N-terminal cleavage/methylation domain-containing protein [Burkholderiaceae bacterium]